MVEQGDNGELFTTHRPKFQTAIAAGGSGEGRGIYKWNSTYYFIRGNVVYIGSYAATVTGPAIGASGKVYFAEVGEYLVWIDTEFNKGYYIHSGTPTVYAEITDVDFPPKQTPALTLVHGAVGFKGRLYVMDSDGTIWNSASEDPTSWNGGDNIVAEYTEDRGECITEHKNHICAIKKRTIEFFYHAGNPTNSPLSVRQDIFYDIGSIVGESVTSSNDVTYFVGFTSTGDKGVWTINNFTLEKISNPDMDMKLAPLGDISIAYGATVESHGRTFYMMNSGLQEYVYDSFTKLWYEWELTEESKTGFFLVNWTKANTGTIVSQPTVGMLFDGDIIERVDDWNDDTVSDQDHVEFKILTDNQSFGSRTKVKFMSNVTLDAFVTHAETEQTSQTAQLRFYDNGEINSAGLPTHDIELLDRYVSSAGNSNVLARAGSFRSRRTEVTIPTDTNKSRVEVYALDFDITEGI